MKMIPRLLPIALTILLQAPPALAQIDERTVKAAYIYNFLQFTEWPTSPNEPFDLCVLGNTALDAELSKLQGKPVRNGTHISIRHVSLNDDLSSCEALYLDDGKRRQVDYLLRKLIDSPVLTISDAEGLADRGVMIEMVTGQNRIVFDVNLKAAREVDMNFSARLLKLARYVATR